jgi:hypothetical protein
MNSRVLLILLVGGVAAFFLQREQARSTFAAVDRGHVDWLLANRKTPVLQTEPTVVWAKLTDADLPEAERQFSDWPLPTEDWELILTELRTYEPRTIAIQSASRLASSEPDAPLKSLTSQLPNLHLGLRGEGAGTSIPIPWPAFSQVQGDINAIPECLLVRGLETAGTYGKLALTQIDLTDTPSAKPGFRDGIWTSPLLFRQGERVFPSLLLQALLAQANLPLESISIRLGEAIDLGGGRLIPIDATGNVQFYHHPINQTSLPTLNADTFKMNPEQIRRFIKAEDPVRTTLQGIKNNLIWFGEDDRSSRRFADANGTTISEAEMNARLLAALQTGRNVRPQSLSGQWIVLGIAIVYGWWMASRPRRGMIKRILAGVGIVGLSSLLTFQTSGLWVPVCPPAIVIALLGILGALLAPSEEGKSA